MVGTSGLAKTLSTACFLLENICHMIDVIWEIIHNSCFFYWMFRRCFFSFKVFSPEIQMKFDKITAVAKGFLTRRLLQTEKLKHLKQTVKVRSAFLLCSFSSCLFLLVSSNDGWNHAFSAFRRIWECLSHEHIWVLYCLVS